MPQRHNDFRDLKIWKQCNEIRQKIWELTKTFPPEEKFRLSDQMIRSSRSTTNCIAEGYGRFHFQENIQFCRHSRGSLFELIDHLIIANDCQYIDNENKDALINEIKSAIRSINGFIKYLQNEKNKA